MSVQASVLPHAALRRSYPPVEVEAALQKGQLQQAAALGWWGDEVAFQLVRSGFGGLPLLVKLDPSTDLGLHLSNDTGVTSVETIAPGLGAAREGQLRPGDIIRQVWHTISCCHSHLPSASVSFRPPLAQR